MRRAAIVFASALALASCGDGDQPQPLEPGATPKATGGAVAVTDGRLGDAVTARPGKSRILQSGARKLPSGAAKAPSGKQALGAEAACTDGDLQPTASNIDQVSSVTLCFMNAMRANEGLPPVVENGQLEDASVKHSQDMVDRKFFAHDTPDGRDVVARLRTAGYIPEDREWVVGENLAWGSGALATPRAIVNAWMNSPAHKENLLSPDYKEVGMGIVPGTPSKDGGNGGATFTTDFGTKLGGDEASGVVDLPTRKATSARKKCAKRRGKAKRRCLRAARKAGRRP
jgi:uncharacterized protein YkwD